MREIRLSPQLKATEDFMVRMFDAEFVYCTDIEGAGDMQHL